MRALALALLLAPALASAAPPPRTDVPWAQSQPWIDVPLPAGTRTWSIEVTGLSTTGTAIDVVVHVVDPGTGTEVAAPLHCTSATVACRADLVAGGTRYALLVHGGPSAQGRIAGSLTVRAGSATTFPFRFSDNVMLDLSGAPRSGYDLVSVLVPDESNAANDHLGTDATEAWLLDENLRLIHADLAFSGVGAAALIRHVESFPAARWALVRPWSPPPAGISLRPGGTVLPVADGSKAPFVGAGRMRVLINDHYGSDHDGDGVSTALEDDARTCNGVGNFADGRACVRMNFLRQYPARAWMDPRDTDGDGISDGAEILGSDVAMGTMPLASGACPAAAAPVPIPDADQTFPLWNFNPRHRDALIEIDRSAAGETTCPSPTSGCPADGTAVDVWQDLVMWHRRYSHLDATRVNNPDRQPGIELHFDARLATVITAAHGERPEFRLRPASGPVRPGLVVYRPDSGGSTCSCNGSSNCADPRHGGYSRYAQYANPGAGGGSWCGAPIGYGRDGGGLAAAHEMGHHLGLQHGGPTTCFGNPFGIDESVSPEIVLPSKMLHVSPMSYLYSYEPAVEFSHGANSGFTLPRPSPGPGDPLAYPERMTLMGNNVWMVRRIFDFSAGAGTPSAYCPASRHCTDLDMDFDGSFDGQVRAPVDRNYYLGRDLITQANDYWCQSEQEPLGGGSCCTTATAIGAPNTCIDGGTPTEPAIARTMLLAGGPATTLANGKWYEFFTDDAITDDDVAGRIPPRRCGRTAAATTGCTPLGDGPMQGKLRWGRVEGWSARSEPRSRTPCRGHASPCGTGVTHGNLTIAGPAADHALWGNTLIAASTVGSGAAEQVVLAWSTRGSPTATGFECSGAACQELWSRLRVRYAASAAIETTGFAVNGAADLRFPDGQDARVSGVALVRWNPVNGATDRTLIVVRQALTELLWWGTCDASGCGVVQPLLVGGVQAQSNGPIAAATENLAVEPWLAIAITTATAEVRLLVAAPDAAGNLVLAERALVTRAGIRIAAIDEAALSIAFTEPGSNRLLLYYEAGTPTTHIVTARDHSLRATGAIRMIYQTDNPWDLTRMAQRVDASGAAVQSAGPGAIPALIYDGRTGVTDDPRIGRLEQRVRVFMSVIGQTALHNQTVTTGDGVPDVEFHDYDEIPALSWGLCPTVAASGLGVAAPDLDLGRPGTPGLRCPSREDWSQGVIAPRLRELAGCRWAGGRCMPELDPRQRVINPADLVSQYLGRPERFEVVQPALPPREIVRPIALPGSLPICAAGFEAAAAMAPRLRDVEDLRRRLPINLHGVIDQLELQRSPPVNRVIPLRP